MPSGRIQDTGEVRLKSALREICEGHGPAIYLTPGQSLLLGDVYWDDRLHIEDHLRRSGLRTGRRDQPGPPLGERLRIAAHLSAGPDRERAGLAGHPPASWKARLRGWGSSRTFSPCG